MSNKKVTVTFEDRDSLTKEEIIANLRAVYGKNTEVTVTPANSLPGSYIHFGISQLVTAEQALIFFDQPEQYQGKLKQLRHEVHKTLQYILNDVIMDNEESFST